MDIIATLIIGAILSEISLLVFLEAALGIGF